MSARDWSSRSGDTRWLTLFTCSNMSELCNAGEEFYRPDKNWQKVVLDNHVQSVCGFSVPIKAGKKFLYAPSRFTMVYAQFLSQLMDKHKVYEPGVACFIDEDRWNQESDSSTHDPNVAAFMEAAWETISIAAYTKGDLERFIKYCKVHTACAVDDTYKWYIGGIEINEINKEGKKILVIDISDMKINRK